MAATRAVLLAHLAVAHDRRDPFLVSHSVWSLEDREDRGIQGQQEDEGQRIPDPMEGLFRS